MNLRPMTMNDADFMLQLKNYEETRTFAIVAKDEIQKEDHYKWLPDNLQYFRVIEDNDGAPIGAIRIQDCEVSIWIKKELWKQGIATFVLQRETDRSMYCKIVAGNVASMRCFIRAGFLPKSYVQPEVVYRMGSYIKSGYYIFQK